MIFAVDKHSSILYSDYLYSPCLEHSFSHRLRWWPFHDEVINGLIHPARSLGRRIGCPLSLALSASHCVSGAVRGWQRIVVERAMVRFDKGVGQLVHVGIIANPSAGRDSHRLVADASTF